MTLSAPARLGYITRLEEAGPTAAEGTPSWQPPRWNDPYGD
jgi:hypothetical protein